MSHGDGAGSDGDGDADSRSMPPSFAQTNASGSAGDLGDFDDNDELLLKPQWADDFECSDGAWGTNTRGDGEADSYRPGTYTLLSANWGGSWKSQLNRFISTMSRLPPLASPLFARSRRGCVLVFEVTLQDSSSAMPKPW